MLRCGGCVALRFVVGLFVYGCCIVVLHWGGCLVLRCVCCSCGGLFCCVVSRRVVSCCVFEFWYIELRFLDLFCVCGVLLLRIGVVLDVALFCYVSVVLFVVVAFVLLQFCCVVLCLCCVVVCRVELRCGGVAMYFVESCWFVVGCVL